MSCPTVREPTIHAGSLDLAALQFLALVEEHRVMEPVGRNFRPYFPAAFDLATASASSCPLL